MASLWPMIGIALCIHVYLALVLVALARKTGTSNGGLAWLPIGNLYLMCAIGRKSAAWMLAMLIPFVNIIGILVAMPVIWGGIARRCGKSPALGWLMLVPPVSLLLPGYLAWTCEPALENRKEASSPPPRANKLATESAIAAQQACPRCHTPFVAGDAFCAECGCDLRKPVGRSVETEAVAAATRTSGPAMISDPNRRSELAPSTASREVTKPQSVPAPNAETSLWPGVIVIAVCAAVVAGGWYIHRNRGPGGSKGSISTKKEAAAGTAPTTTGNTQNEPPRTSTANVPQTTTASMETLPPPNLPTTANSTSPPPILPPPPISNPLPPAEKQAIWQRASQRIWSNDLRGALADLKMIVLGTDSNDSEMRGDRTTLELLVGDPRVGLAEAEALLKVWPNAPNIWVLHGQALIWNRNPAGVESLKRAMQLDPNVVNARYADAEKFLTARVPMIAYLHFTTVLNMNPNMAGAHYGLGIACSQLGYNAMAIREFELYLRYDSTSGYAQSARQELQRLRR
jgi:hypothetical protein